jgi:hypothetical protein
MSNILTEIGTEFDLSKNAATVPDPVIASASKLTQGLSMKPKIPLEEIPEEMRGKALTGKDLEELAELLSDRFDRRKKIQIVSKTHLPITDFSKLTEADIYNPDVFIEAKPFMSSDTLKISLIDKNYEPRWVNKNNQRLGYMLSIGFTYVEEKDLESSTDAMVYLDASGHYTINDVVAVKIPKSIYYPALRAAAIRAQNVVSSANASSNGAAQASQYMQGAKDDNGGSVGDEFAEAQRAGYLKFYDPKAT